MDHHAGVADEGGEVGGDGGEDRLVGEEGGGEAVDADRLLGHLALRVDVGVEGAPRGHVVDDLDGAELDDAVAGRRVESGRLGVEHDLTHAPLPAARR